jgi:hypothetical protein
MSETRKLVADVVGYSRLSGVDEDRIPGESLPRADDSRYRKAIRSIFVNGLPALLSRADS